MMRCEESISVLHIPPGYLWSYYFR